MQAVIKKENTVANLDENGSKIRNVRNYKNDTLSYLEIEAALSRAVNNLNASHRLFIEAGLDLLAVKNSCEHGEFSEKIEQYGLHVRQAQRAMQYAEYVMSRPEEEQKTLLEMPRSSVLKLASADPEVIEAIVESKGGFDKVSALTLKELQDELEIARQRADNIEKNLEREIKALNADKEIAESKLRAARARNERLPFELETVKVRQESLVAQADVEVACSTLKKLFDDATNEALAGTNTSETQLRIETAWLTANAALARVQSLVTSIRSSAEDLGLELPSTIAHVHIMTDEEAADWIRDWNTIISTKRGEELARDEARKEAAGRGAGRPKKVAVAKV